MDEYYNMDEYDDDVSYIGDTVIAKYPSLYAKYDNVPLKGFKGVIKSVDVKGAVDEIWVERKNVSAPFYPCDLISIRLVLIEKYRIKHK